MTILSACDQAKRLMGFGAMATLYASVDPFAVELGAIANEAAPDIARRHDWRKLHLLKTQAGNGTATAFDLPTDYDRMPVKASVFLNSSKQPMTPIQDLDVWLQNRLQSLSGNEWMLLSGQIHIFPAMGASDSAKFYYITNLIVDPVTGANKTAFTIDTDVFLLPERLLTLSLIYRWRHIKGYDYVEDMQNFEIALAQAIARDKGSRILAIGEPRMPAGDPVFPGTIS